MLDSPSHLGGRSSLRKESALCSVSEGVPVRWTTGVCPFRLTVCVAVCVLRVGCERRQRDRGAAAGALLGAWLGAGGNVWPAARAAAAAAALAAAGPCGLGLTVLRRAMTGWLFPTGCVTVVRGASERCSRT